MVVDLEVAADQPRVIGEFQVSKGDVEAAFARAPHTLKRRSYHHRYNGVPMETRGVVASNDPRTDSMTVWSSTPVVGGQPGSNLLSTAVSNGCERMAIAAGLAAGGLHRQAPSRAGQRVFAARLPNSTYRCRLKHISTHWFAISVRSRTPSMAA